MNADDVPGYEFEAPRGFEAQRGPRPWPGPDSLWELLQAAAPEPAPASARADAPGRGVWAVMRGRNWLTSLAVPLLAAVIVGISVVVIVGGGGNGGAAPSALAAGFPPARLAGPAFTGAAVGAIAGSAATQVAAGSIDGAPALWTSADGGGVWRRAVLVGTGLAGAGLGSGRLTGVARGPAGWVAVGTSPAGPLVASSANTRTWTVSAIAGAGTGTTATAVAAGPGGYVIVGHAGTGAAAWYLASTGWPRAVLAPQAGEQQAPEQQMNAVTAVTSGFVAIGTAEAGTAGSTPVPAAWWSADGRTWHQVAVGAPAGAARATLDYVAANGAEVVAAGTEFSAAGAGTPFAEVSADQGRTWTLVPLPVPRATGVTTATAVTAVTALTAAGGGFTAAGTYGTKAGPEVVIWSLASARAAANAAAWAAATPQGTGLATAAAENTITALTAAGATLTGVGFTAVGDGIQHPTLWQSPIRS